jgi:hypothetical protein
MSFLGKVIHEFEQKFSDVGIPDFPPPGAAVGTYEHREIIGNGLSFSQAVEDFESHLPEVPPNHILTWRVFPDVVTEMDYDIGQRRCRIYARCVMLRKKA